MNGTDQRKSSKLQHPEKFQTSSSKKRTVFGAWNFSGAWMLVLGIYFF
jgi:hypothetical protein